MTKYARTSIIITARHAADQNTSELSKQLLAPLRSIEPQLNDSYIFERVELTPNEDFWLDHAKTAAANMFSEAVDAITAFYEATGNLATEGDYGELSQYGDSLFDMEEKIDQIYNIEEEMVSDNALANAAVIIESNAFNKHSPGLDRGSWEEQDDPIQSVKNMANDLYQDVVKEYFQKHMAKASELLRERNMRAANQKQSLAADKSVIEEILTEAKTLDDE